MHSASDVQSPVGDAFLAAVYDVEMVEADSGEGVPWSHAPPLSEHQSAERQLVVVPVRSSLRGALEQHAVISSVVSPSMTTLQAIDKVLIAPSAAAVVRHRSSAREKLYADPIVYPLERDRSPAAVRPSTLLVTPLPVVKPQSHVAIPSDVLKHSPMSSSITVEAPDGVHAVTVMSRAAVSPVHATGSAPLTRVGVHWGEDVCEGSSPPPKRLSGSFREGGTADLNQASDDEDYGDSAFRASLFGTEP